jgi:hypothetical protein
VRKTLLAVALAGVIGLAALGGGVALADAPGRSGAWRAGACPWWPGNSASGEDAATGSLADSQAAAEAYLDDLGLEHLVVTEVMRFERNDYAIVSEPDSGVGAMELLIDPVTGRVGPEPGPNMMWNERYGMHQGRGGWGMMGRGWGMMGRGWDWDDDAERIDPEEAEDLAQEWLDAHRPGWQAEHPDPFYGYYTLHVEEDGEIAGMLSVHQRSGDVWFHSWHGAFVEMLEHEEE